MNALKNTCTFIGNLGNDPQPKTFDSGKNIATFQLAINETYMSGEERKTNTTWINVAAWNKGADLVTELLSKGDEIVLNCKAATREYEKDGEKRIVTEFVMNEFYKTTKKEDSPE